MCACSLSCLLDLLASIDDRLLAATLSIPTTFSFEFARTRGLVGFW